VTADVVGNPSRQEVGRCLYAAMWACEFREVVEMGESRTPRPEPFDGSHYERVRSLSSISWRGSAPSDEIHSRVSRSSLIPGYVALPGPQPRCMTLPQPARRRLLPRSPYGLSREGESRLLVGRYFVLPPV
jgi:hypothetical protein